MSKATVEALMDDVRQALAEVEQLLKDGADQVSSWVIAWTRPAPAPNAPCTKPTVGWGPCKTS